MRTPYTAEDERLQNPELKVNLYSRQRLVSTLTIKTAAGLAEALERIGRQKEAEAEEEALQRIGRSFEPDKMRLLLLFTASLSFLASCHGREVNMYLSWQFAKLVKLSERTFS